MSVMSICLYRKDVIYEMRDLRTHQSLTVVMSARGDDRKKPHSVCI